MTPSLFEAVFGYDPLSIDWHIRENIKAVCQRHYKYLRRKDGIELGYRKINGVTRAYVKTESF